MWRPALFKRVEYSGYWTEALSLSGLAERLSLKRPLWAGEAARLWEVPCALLRGQMWLSSQPDPGGGVGCLCHLTGVPTWGERITEHLGSFQPDSWTNRLSCVPAGGSPTESTPGGAGPVCRGCADLSGSWTLFPQSLQGADLQQENLELRTPCGFSTVSAS